MAQASTVEVEELIRLVPGLLKLKAKELWVDYDEEADVLYISLQRPQHSTDSETLDNGVLLRYRNDQLVGITVLNASQQPL
ncbi:MAG TPA: DUF2283 domain-containing protein [Candidatus Fraserbacteria bacterium]|nr:DUF2283 domain-containing protein [Candidatus Fraserbacteria bacterium]